MLPDLGVPFLGLPELVRVRDLEAFEGPILSLLKGGRGSYLEKWCTRDEGTVRTLIVRTEQRAVAEYLARRISMYDLFTVPNDGAGFLTDSQGGRRTRVSLVEVSRLPERYLPRRDAMHDESLRPEWPTTPQSFLFDSQWDAKLFADLEKLYLEVFAFTYLADPNLSGPPLPKTAGYSYNHGYAYWRTFEALRRKIPKDRNARSAGVAAASPGVLTIEAPTDTASRVIDALAAAAQPATQAAYEQLHSWSKLRHEKADLLPQSALEDLTRLCRLLNVDLSKIHQAQESLAEDDEHEREQALLVSGKLIAAYCRRLWRLIWSRSGVEFLADLPERGSSEPPLSAFEEEGEDEPG
jgi:hypothetical protein